MQIRQGRDFGELLLLPFCVGHLSPVLVSYLSPGFYTLRGWCSIAAIGCQVPENETGYKQGVRALSAMAYCVEGGLHHHHHDEQKTKIHE